MASPPESTPNSNDNESSKEQQPSNKSSDSSSSAPSSSQSTSSSPPPKSPPPPPPQESPPPPPPPKSSSPPPKESPSPPPQQDSPPPSSSPPPQQHSPPPTDKPTPTHSPPPHSTTPLLPLPTTTTPNPVPTAAISTAPGGVFYPPPPISALSPASSTSKEKSASSSSSHNQNSSGSKNAPVSDTQSTINVAIIAGITAASVLLIALVILTITCLLKKKKKPYHEPPKGCDPYGGTPTQWHSPQGHVIQISPPPGVMGTPAGGGGGWAAQSHMGGGDGGWMPLPTSSEFSSNHSGGHVAGHHTPPMHGQQSPNMGLGLSKSQFTYDELAAATGGFSQANLLGQGGFGYVHKGVLPNGQIVAVKSLKSGSGQGEREFQAEVEIISRVHHRHLVSLVGYCIADGQRMLVYEYVPNKTMEFHLHGKGQPVMDWPTRLRIALGSAKGLGYLHEDCHPKIIHRDIKAANILLDDKFEAMVADFGLAKLSEDNNTHVSTRVMGTFGYLAPEYASSGKLTEKSDVFSFGVMLLELITGRKPVDTSHQFSDDSLVDWARPVLTKAIEEGNYKELVDPRLEDNFDPDEMVRMVACAAACIRHSARRRPKMTQIVRTLDGDSSLDDLNEGGKAGQVASSNGETQVYDTGAYNADMLKFRQLVMSSQEFVSGETTSECEQSTSSSSGDSCDGSIHSGAQRQKL